MIEVQSSVESILSQGYAIVPNVLSPSHVESLSQALNSAQIEDNRQYGEEYLYKIGQEGFVINVGDRGEPFERLLLERPVMKIIDAILGNDAFLYLFQGVIVPPGGGIGAYPWKWHCDLYHIALDVQDKGFIPGLNCLFYIDNVDAKNGGTWIIPGSQGLLDEEVPREEPEFLAQSAIQLQASAGSVVIFNPLLWHCAGANTTDKPRRAVKMLMVRGWMLPQMDYSRSLKSEVLERLDDEALRILGHQSQIRRSFKDIPARSSKAFY